MLKCTSLAIISVKMNNFEQRLNECTKFIKVIYKIGVCIYGTGHLFLSPVGTVDGIRLSNPGKVFSRVQARLDYTIGISWGNPDIAILL